MSEPTPEDIGDDTPATPAELLRADEILSQIAKDMEIEFNLRCDEMQRPEAERHFRDRQALAIVRSILLDKGENLLRQ